MVSGTRMSAPPAPLASTAATAAGPHLVALPCDVARSWQTGAPWVVCVAMPTASGARLAVASLNLHAGVRRDGSPFDVADAVRSLDADVVVLQEAWVPDDDPRRLVDLAAADGYELCWAPVGSGALRLPGDRQGSGVLGASAVRMDPAARRQGRGADRVTPPAGGGGLGPVPAVGGGTPAVPAAVATTGSGAAAGRSPVVVRGAGSGGPAAAAGPRGTIGTAVLSALPVRRSEAVPLHRLAGDQARRSLLLCTLAFGDTELHLAATHMTHLSQGSLRHFAAVRQLLAERWPRPGLPRLLVGDMNLWGPVVERVLPGWRRAVVGRSWPAVLPVAQPDHILVGGGLVAVAGGVLPPVGSDHRPVRAELRLTGGA